MTVKTVSDFLSINIKTSFPVDSRLLHEWLEIGRDHPTWFQDLVESYGFVENQDFRYIPPNGGKPLNGRPSKNYCMTLSMAMQSAMVSKSPKGKETRLFFIDCMEQLKTFLESMSKGDLFRYLAEREDEAEALRLEQHSNKEFIENHVHFPKHINVTEFESGQYLSRKKIRSNYFPELGSIDRVTLVLTYYKCEMLLFQYGEIVREVFNSEDLVSIREQFEKDLIKESLSRSGKTFLCRHIALPGMTLNIPIAYFE
jgi:phage anti-repressor protein